jgi:hypothetical protein
MMNHTLGGPSGYPPGRRLSRAGLRVTHGVVGARPREGHSGHYSALSMKLRAIIRSPSTEEVPFLHPY